ncbi:TrkA C-terminal domain-containing protein [Antrihabitans sp. YC2-6]|uniref:TrkA C-terminal domain-containing protein n=1 Tax=Antrihabitans sp. YC2-6 TaxID=2799498 RepID=UPI002277EDCD|nr:TrkA C-terminal domain-containing protein [Antrihabitans sp. YC2-6]
MSPPKLVLTSSMLVVDAIEAMADLPGAPVVDANERFVGTVAPGELYGRAPDEPIGRSVDVSAPTVSVEGNLADAVDALPQGHRWVTVLDDDRKIRGIVGAREIVHGYRTAAAADVHRFASLSPHADLLDVRVGKNSPFVGKALGECEIPESVIVLTVLRGDAALPGTATSVFQADDLVTLVGPHDALGQVSAQLAAQDR